MLLIVTTHPFRLAVQELSGVAVVHQAMGLLAQEVQLAVEGKQQILQTFQQQVSALQLL